MKGSIIITAFFIAGIVCAQTGLLPLGIIDDNWSFYALCLLMFCVGMSVGNDSDITRQFCGIDPLLLMLPLVTIAGTLAGTFAVSLFMPHRQLTDCLDRKSVV